jgi:hypothetical protein
MIIPSDDFLGYVDTELDMMFCVDDFGNLVPVPFCLFQGYFQEH